jgi:PQQ-dependent catabolism-associated CXXCW motif protein
MPNLATIRLGKRAPASAALLVALGLGILLAAQAVISSPQERFDPVSGYRISDVRAPVPLSIAGGTAVDVDGLEALIAKRNPLLIDVLGNDPGRLNRYTFGLFGQLPERWNIPGSVRLPDFGKGSATAAQTRDMRLALERLTGANRAQPLVFYCIVNCWVSWNAARRAIAFGYAEVYWFRDGTETWADAGLPLEKAAPPGVVPDAARAAIRPQAR